MVVAIIAILASLLLPALAAAKAKGRSVVCKNNLHQLGLSLSMYVNDHHFYPFNIRDQDSRPSYWMDSLSGFQWTNSALHCPGYTGQKGKVFGTRINHVPKGSYAYNDGGTAQSAFTGTPLGLGGSWLDGSMRNAAQVADEDVRVPSEMIAITDARVLQDRTEGPIGYTDWFWDWIGTETLKLRHGKNFNVMYCDGHVPSEQRAFLLDPRRSYQNWNHDRQEHKETWIIKPDL